MINLYINKLFFKRWIIRLLLISFTFSSLFGCNVGNNSVNISKPSAQAKSSTTPDNFEGVAANVIAHDGIDQDSNLSFVPDNYSGWDFEYLGCEGSNIGAYDPETISFGANYMFPTTIDYDDIWVSDNYFRRQADGSKTPIYDKAYINDHAIRFNKSKGNEGWCYLRLTNPRIGKAYPLYLKTKFEWKTECAQGLPGCNNTSTRVMNLLEDASNRNNFWTVLSFGSAGAAGIFSKWVLYRNSLPQKALLLFKGKYNEALAVYGEEISQLNWAFEQFKGFEGEQFRFDSDRPYILAKDGKTKLTFMDVNEDPVTLKDKGYTSFQDEIFKDGEVRYNRAKAYRLLRREIGIGGGGSAPLDIISANEADMLTEEGLNRRIFKFLQENKRFSNKLKIITTKTGKKQHVFQLEPRPAGYKFVKDSSGLNVKKPYYFEGVTEEGGINIIPNGINTIEYEMSQFTSVGEPLPTTSKGYNNDERLQFSKAEFERGLYNEQMNFKKFKIFKLENETEILADGKIVRLNTGGSYSNALLSKATSRSKLPVLAKEFVYSGLKDNVITLAVLFTVIVGVYAYGDLTGPAAMGTTTVTINHIKLEVPTDKDVTSWNANHPANKQIEANTSLVAISLPNLISQTVMLSYKNFLGLGINGQSGVQINLKSLTTPIQRLTKYNPYGENKDPWLDCIAQHDCGDLKTNKSNAVLTMTINDKDSYIMENKDIDMNQSIEAGLEAGVPALSAAEPLAPPEVEVVGNTHASNLDGIVLRQNEPVNLKVTLPKNGSANVYGAGLSAKLVTEYDALEPGEKDTESHTRIVYSEAQSLSAEKSYGSEVSVFTSIFDCKIPVKLGEPCLLTIKISGTDDGKPHMGRLMIADVTSFVRYIPVYINYHLIQKLKVVNVDKGDNSVHKVVLSNVSGKMYKNFVVEGLPNGARLENNCTNVPSDSDCSLDFELGNLTPGKYVVRAYGINENNQDKALNEIAAMDTAKISINVAEETPW